MLATVEAQKPGQLRVENGELRVEMRRGEAAAATLNSQLSTLNSARAAAATLNSQLSTLNSTRAANGGHPSPSPYVPDLGMGAWEESLRVGLPDVFPFGDEHLEAVEIFTQGYVRPRFNSAAKIADVGARLAIVPGLTTFTYGATTDGGYRIDWADAAVNRDTNNLMTAAIELFRCGDVCVTTNGVSSTIPRELPFAHDGFGQDAEWVAANFTNATEIAAAGGYAAWVDAQVGEGLTNGLYKLTVGVAEDPPETVNLIVGDLSVAVTNAGEYVFLLEKGVEYDYGTVPFLTNVTSAAVDDVPRAQVSPRLLSAVAGGAGAWTVDGGYENREPTAEALGRVAWWPLFCGSPDVSHIGPDDGPVTFDAILSDYCGISAVTYEWTASEGLTVVSPHAQSTAVRIEDMPSWAEACLAVTATIGAKTLYSYTDRLTYGTNDTPQVHLSLSLPSKLIVRDQWMEGSESATVAIAFRADAATNGELRVWLERGAAKAETSAALPMTVAIDGETHFSQRFALDGIAVSDAQGDVEVRCAFVDADGVTNATASAATTVLSPRLVSVPSAPATGLAVVKGAGVGVTLAVAPQISAGVLTQWQTAKRKTRTQYDPWVLRAVGAPEATLTMDEAGVFALRAVVLAGGGCQSNAVEYVHLEDEPYLTTLEERRGPCRSGDRNHIGVATTQGLLSLRAAAVSRLGQQTYGKDVFLAARNGFGPVKKGHWKCNQFVADMAMEVGFVVPARHRSRQGYDYPPLANEWALESASIIFWVYLGDAYPEPGFIAARPSGAGSGHCGIVDYDGWTICARPHGVGRKAERMLDGTIHYRRPEETAYENNQ